MPRGDKINEKEKRFCVFYLEKYNGARAARKSGYSKDTARQIAYELLTKPHIKAYLKELLSNINIDEYLPGERLIKVLAAQIFVDASDYYNEDGTLKPFSKLTKDQRAAIQSLDITDWESDKASGQKRKLKLYDKQKAIDLIMKIKGLADGNDGNTPEFYEKIV